MASASRQVTGLSQGVTKVNSAAALRRGVPQKRKRVDGIKVKVNFYGYLRDVTKDESLQLVLPEGATLKALITLLIEKYGDRFKERLMQAEGRLNSDVSVLLNGSSMDERSLEKTLMHPRKKRAEVTIAVLPAVIGA